jgi:molybdopterin-containing oxidoreductase family membrane subunit
MRELLGYIRERLAGSSKKFYIYCLILLVIGGLGLGGSITALAEGHYHSNMSDMVPWGVFISGLAFFIGLSAGATMVGLLIHGFGREDYHPVGTRAILIGLMSIFAAMGCVMMDVGNPFRAMKIPFLLRNESSMFFISSSSYMGFMTILMAELISTIQVTRGKAGIRGKRVAKILGIVAVPYALIVVHSFTGTIFGVVKAREMWNTPLLPVHFVTSALASGFALVILVTIITSWVKRKDLVSRETYNHMGIMLCFFLIATVFLDTFDYLIISYSGTEEGLETWHLITGRYLPTFLINMVGLYGALAIVAFKKGRTPRGLLYASAITIIAIAAYRINLISIGQLVPLYHEIGEIEYVPNIHEIAPFIGLVAMLMFLFALLTKILPLEDEAHAGSHGDLNYNYKTIDS